ncbi:MAG: hypothetical protein U1E43_06550 [Rhodospirillales bacterium]
MRRDDDREFDRDGVGVLIDEISLELLKGAELDYVEDLIAPTSSSRTRTPRQPAAAAHRSRCSLPRSHRCVGAGAARLG